MLRRFRVVGATEGEVMQVQMTGHRRMLGKAVPWIAKPANGKPIWAEWFPSPEAAADWLVN